MDQVQLCRGFTIEQWRALSKKLAPGGAARQDQTAWNCAIEIFDRRIRERFFSCIEVLQEADPHLDVDIAEDAPADCSTLPDGGDKANVVPGFAIMALCCLLIETLQSFCEDVGQATQPSDPCTWPKGKCNKDENRRTSEKFKIFLQRRSFGDTFKKDSVAQHFVDGVRNGILHDAETRRCVIWREEPEGQIIEKLNGRYALNRKLFYEALKAEFESYLCELRDPNKAELRDRFLKKMDEIVKKC
jgi:hypothetical protein